MITLRTYAQYELVKMDGAENMVIRRNDDDHPRTVCFIENQFQWNRFTAALRAGRNETQAVIDIDR